MPGLLT